MEEKLVITGGKKLEGKVEISGAKNAAVAIVAAALLVEGQVTIENVPIITDVKIMLEALEELGVLVVRIDDKTYRIDATTINNHKTPYGDLSKVRSSYYFVGALLGRCKKAEVTFPGGCNFGQRPIDQHVKGFEALGASVEISGGYINAKAKKLVGAKIYFDVATVGATINSVLAAVLAEGTTILENANREPHIVDMANFLNMMGADIKGAGTNVIRINGVKKLLGGKSYTVSPDMIEAGTFMILAAATKGNITVTNIIPEHMESLSAKLIETGAIVEKEDDNITVRGTKKTIAVNVKTLPYPGFPTDLHPQMVSYLLSINEQSNLTEGVWDTRRFQYIEQLQRMHADIRIEGSTAIINGGKKLIGAPVRACDLRAAAALVIAGLIAEGETSIYNLEYLDRGYEDFVKKIQQLGANAKRVKEQQNGNK